MSLINILSHGRHQRFQRQRARLRWAEVCRVWVSPGPVVSPKVMACTMDHAIGFGIARRECISADLLP